METLTAFFSMGGYALFVWSAYLVSLLLLGALVWSSLSALKRAESRLQAMDESGVLRRGQRRQVPDDEDPETEKKGER